MALLSRTLQKKILFIILFVSIVPAVLGILQLYGGSLLALDSTIGGYLEERCLNLSKNIEQIIREKYLAMEEICSNPENMQTFRKAYHMAVSGDSTQEVDSDLEEIYQETPLQGHEFLLVNASGKVLYRPDNDREWDLYDTRWWTLLKDVRHGEVFLIQNLHEGEPKPDLILACPFFITDNNPERFYVMCSFSAEHIFNISRFVRESERWTLGIYSVPGDIVYSRGFADRVAPLIQTRWGSLRNHYSGWFPTQEINDQKHIVSYSNVPFLRTLHHEKKSNFEWLSFIAFDVSDMVILIDLLIWRMSLFGLVMVIVLILLALYLSRKIVLPIKRLHEAMIRISRGNLESRVQIRTGDEIEDLAEGFNKMATQLSRTYCDLEKRMEELNEQRKQMSLIHEITQAINSELDLEEIFSIVATEMKRIVDYDCAAIALWDEEWRSVQPAVIYPETPDSETQTALFQLLDGEFLTNFTQEAGAVIAGDIENDWDDPYSECCSGIGVKSAVIAPLRSTSGIMGCIFLGSFEVFAYGKREKRIVPHVTEAVSAAIDHSRLYERVRKFAEQLEQKVKERTEELERTHQSLMLTEKLAASGKLAAGVAHEINNPLGIINNYLKIFVNQWNQHNARLESLGLNLEPLEVIKDELDRIARIVRSLLDLYRPPEGKKSSTDINYEIERLIELMGKSLEKKDIEVILHLSENLPKSRLATDQVCQVLLNILTNAEDAVGREGTIRIATRHLSSSEREGKYSKDFIEVLVEDSGHGIPPEVMSHIFDPFYTTKDKGSSTGLGLSVTYTILESMGGKISINSDPGRGTRVRILFPVEKVEDESSVE